MIAKLLLSLFDDGQHRIDALRARFPGHDDVIDAAFQEGATFYTSRAADLEEASLSGITVDEFKQVEQQWNQQRAAGLN